MIHRLLEIDSEVFLFLNNLGTEAYDDLWRLISNQISMFCFVLLIVIFCLFSQKKIRPISLLFTLIFCVAITDIVHVHIFKNVFMRLRPCWNIDLIDSMRLLVNCGGKYGFVSGHAANATAITTFIILAFKPKHVLISYILIIWCLLVSYSRIYLGKHYPLDLIGGACLGFLIAFCMFIFFKKFHKNNI
ncbi:MAG: phosphatase PAP2 family protein [Flavobacteriales bacterium]|nr:phosphatase PAP2 family protein [Flavobacteriales bacterium]|tara:strand:+ start:1069 stop:1635 length:567 start_codon:yes stop_codon:yes gene_type:complete